MKARCDNCGGPLSKAIGSKCWYCGAKLEVKPFPINDSIVYAANEEAALSQFFSSALANRLANAMIRDA